MIFATPETANYYNDLVKMQRRDQFRALMFLPVDLRQAAIAIYALDIELEHIHHAVKEEMIGHIRYAWWRENLGKMESSDQPVLKALSQINITKEELQKVVAAYGDVFPEMPEGIDKMMEDVVKRFVANNDKWIKATAIINNHRKKYGKKLESLMLVKLLFI